jgi:hypothetical protein
MQQIPFWKDDCELVKKFSFILEPTASVVYCSEFLATDPEVPGNGSKLPRVGATRKKKKMGLERGPLSLVRIIEELLERKVAAPVYKTKINGGGDSLH